MEVVKMEEDYVLRQVEEIVEEREKAYQTAQAQSIDWSKVKWVCEVCGETNGMADIAKCKYCGS